MRGEVDLPRLLFLASCIPYLSHDAQFFLGAEQDRCSDLLSYFHSFISLFLHYCLSVVIEMCRVIKAFFLFGIDVQAEMSGDDIACFNERDELRVFQKRNSEHLQRGFFFFGGAGRGDGWGHFSGFISF